MRIPLPLPTHRLSGLLEMMREAKLDKAAMGRFYVLGGECNYLYRCTESMWPQIKSLFKILARIAHQCVNAFRMPLMMQI